MTEHGSFEALLQVDVKGGDDTSNSFQEKEETFEGPSESAYI